MTSIFKKHATMIRKIPIFKIFLFVCVHVHANVCVCVTYADACGRLEQDVGSPACGCG